ncbi:MAG: NAD-dependent epimerase/dehydratase family protein [Lachnospiraceae bacterium]|nr:NAD-dependent epimerase/dehydratase family protein [Lachnospiraceae bacterium]
MKILIIGGTWFLGRAFAEKLTEEKKKPGSRYEDAQVWLLNRGSRPAPSGVTKSITADRHDAEALAGCDAYGRDFDLIVDFCAYEEGDIAALIESLNVSFEQYIFISTCDVYAHFCTEPQDEEAELEKRLYPGQEGDYIRGKVKLEAELSKVCKEKNAHYTSIRPSMIYGPGNYAPREGIYFNWIEKAAQILQPFDATGSFQPVFVEDVAQAILLTGAEKEAYDRAFNVCGNEIHTYASFAKCLKDAVDKKFECVYMTVEEIEKKRIPLPFPLTAEESTLYTGERIIALGLSYAGLTEGLKKSYATFTK